MAFAETMTRLRDNSFMRLLTADPEAARHHPNQTMREVTSGHFVPVVPRPLPHPVLVLYSPELAQELGLQEPHCTAEAFARFFSGDMSMVPDSEAWATPYALSIYGQFQGNRQCPFRNGLGYGDGRALSVQELVAPCGQRWELQLKGAGTTPFCRGGDGRAVLRSSIREFLASEAMEHLGVATTRALSLVVSRQERVQRPRPEEDVLGSSLESCAITCRAAPSFLRVGHFEVFGRRAVAPPKGLATAARQALSSLEMLVDHALAREFGGVQEGSSKAERARALLKNASERVAETTAQWLRVGFCQGNFNSDNCLVSGRTMDYGPFGFIEEFDPDFGSWVGSSSHFAFMNQPQAGMMNIRSLVEALAPLLEEDQDAALKSAQAAYLQASENAKVEVWQKKLGLQEWSSEAAGLLSDFLRLMESCMADWTITWRQLAAVLVLPQGSQDEALLGPILSANSHTSGIAARSDDWKAWLRRWLAMVDRGHGRDVAAQIIRANSPKYVPREWMLKDAYTAAQQEGDFSLVKELFEVFKQPYSEQPEFAHFFVCKRRVAIS